MKHAQRLRYARERAGLTLEEVAAFTGLEVKLIQQLESGRQKSSPQDTVLSHHLCCSKEWLSKEKGQMDDILVSQEELKLLKAFRACPDHLKPVLEFVSESTIKNHS